VGIKYPPGLLPILVSPYEAYYYIFLESNHPLELANVTFTFGVNRTWMTSKRHDTSSIALQRLVGNWVVLPTQFIGENDGYFVYSSTSPGLSWFAITGRYPIPTPLPEPEFTVESPNVTVRQGNKTITRIATGSIPGYSNSVEFTADTPPGMTVQFVPGFGTLGSETDVIITVENSTETGTYSIPITAKLLGLDKSSTFNLGVFVRPSAEGCPSPVLNNTYGICTFVDGQYFVGKQVNTIYVCSNETNFTWIQQMQEIGCPIPEHIIPAFVAIVCVIALAIFLYVNRYKIYRMFGHTTLSRGIPIQPQSVDNSGE
jgi:hypothetical protein